MEEALRGHLAATPTITALVDQRIQWGISEDRASIALHLIDAPPDWHLKGRSGIVPARVQIDCWAPDFLTAKAIGDAVQANLPEVRQVIDGVRFHGAVVLDVGRDHWGESPNLLFRTRIDVRITFSLAS